MGRYRCLSFICALLLGCAPVPPQETLDSRRPNHPLLDSMQIEVLREVNAARQTFGAPVLTDDPGMTRAAVLYSAELAVRGRLDHFSAMPGRQTLRDRLHSERVSFLAAGENLARIEETREALPRHVVISWLHSPAHKHTMLDWRFARSGIGITRDPTGLWYIVQVFAAPE